MAAGAVAAPLLAKGRRVCKEGCPGCRLDQINKTNTGVPYLNFFYVWVVCLCAALPIQSLFPYLYFMIRDLKVAKQEEDIGFYAGFVGAAYFLGRTTSAVPWGMFADKYGRKPCIMISILSVIVFNTLFGLSTTYWMAIITRGLLGLLCGILGPIKAYASEVCRKEHQALGISLVTSSRSIALIIGPAIGGFLARETLHMYHDEKMEAIDAMGAQVTDLNIEDGKANQLGSDRMASTKSLLKNRQLMSAITLYCVFSLHDTAYLEIFSLWAVSSRKYRGLSLTSQDVGTALAISGFGVLVYQLVIYPLLAKYAGLIKPFRFAAATITVACNILQNTAVIQEQRGVANGISVTLMSIFKAVAPAAGGILFSWAQKNITGLFLPGTHIRAYTDLFIIQYAGDHILFFMLNMVSVIGLSLTFKPFFSMTSVMK
uniref:Putative membrane protein n=1 Tax=Aegilops tauschii TaxID=37682 RepID=N1R392_AEGTA